MDKVGLIKELLENWGKAKLFPVVYIRLKDVDTNSYKVARGMALKTINQVARRLQFFDFSINIIKSILLYSLMNMSCLWQKQMNKTIMKK